MARGRRNRPPAPATRLRLTSASPNDERVVATTRSQASTISHPPAVARPSTAAMTGLRALAVGEAGEAAPLGAERRPVAELMALRSAPALKTGSLLARGVGPQDADPDLGVGLELVDGRLHARRPRRR